MAANAQTIYIGPASGNWGDAANWSTGSVPGAEVNVSVDSRGQNSTVLTGTSQTRNALSLEVDAGDAISIGNNSILHINGQALQVDGVIRIDATNSGTSLSINNPNTALSGGGTISLTGGNSRIVGTGGLINGATIEGLGNIGFNQTAIVNSAGGLINANSGGNALFLDPRNDGGLVNQGILRASGSGILQISGGGGGGFNNVGGIIEAIGADSEVQLFSGASITGGTIRSEGGGLIRGNTSDNYYFTDVTFSGGTQVRANNNSDFGVLGTITNDGTITVAATNSGTDIELQGTTTFAGTGKVVLGINNNNARINGTGTLTNVATHTIQGRGNVGFNTLGIVNDGMIIADQEGGALYIDPSAAGNLDNNGTMQSSAGGILQLSGSGGGVFENNDGVIQAVGAGSEVQLHSGAAITGGVLQTQNGGLIRGNASDNYFFTDVTFGLGTQVIANNNSDFGVMGTITNRGTITVAATNSGTDIELQGDTLFTGTGTVVLGINNQNARINGTGVLTIDAGQTMRGRGNIGFNTLGIVNKGTITAEATGGALVIDPSLSGNLDNDSTMQATAGGTLLLTGGGGGAFDNSDGVIQAIGEGAEVQLFSGASITGGVLQTQNGGLIRGNTSDDYFFTNVSFPAGTQVRANNNSDFGVLGTITNDGTITVAATNSGTDIELQGATIFAGNGNIVLGIDNNNARINGTGTLTNTATHTIQGRGNIGFNTLGIVNDGMIIADQEGGALFIDPSAGGDLDNNGIMQSSAGGLLQLSGGGGGGLFENTGGVIQAIGSGSEVQLYSGASIIGGVLQTQAGGVIRGNTSDNYFFTDVTFALGTQVIANNNSDFGVLGTITNHGTITVAATNSGTDIELQGDTAFIGGGEIVLGIDNDNARINGTGTLTNGSGHTIRGRGNVGFGTLAVFNAKNATIVADQTGAPLFIDPVAGMGSFDNRGLLNASGGGLLQLSGTGGGSFDNAGGIIRAGDGSEVQLLSNVAIDGGLIDSQGSGLVRLETSQTATISNATISANSAINNNATLFLSGDITHSGNLSINA
ncbi:MAG: hypothetical protein KDN22_07270, partial [Verrucomicrobiae bacterium]|nr:hypothetical protein [Verrucomicrobiae bacterium]